MSNNIYTAGLGNVGSYQVSGAPYASGSIVCHNLTQGPIVIQFPYVTKWVHIQNNSTVAAEDLRVGFSSLGITNSSNYFVLPNRQATTTGDRSAASRFTLKTQIKSHKGQMEQYNMLLVPMEPSPAVPLLHSTTVRIF